MMNVNEDNERSRFSIPASAVPRVILFFLTIICICSMGYYYLKKENVVSVGQAAGLVLIPLQKGINGIGAFVFDLEQDRLQIDAAKEEINTLKAENERLRLLVEEQNRMVYDYREAERLLELKDTYSSYPTVGANVVFRNASSNWYSTFTIDRGSEDGLKKNMNVIADGGLVGYLSEVGKHYSVVSSIINDSVNVSGMQLSTRDSCMVIGDLALMKEQGLLRIDYMKAEFDASADSVIVTSRVSDRYFPGIKIGYVTETRLNQDLLTRSGFLKPSVDFEHLSRVLVITDLKRTED